MSCPLPPLPVPNICRTQAACHWTHRAMVSEGEAVFGHVCHEEWRPKLVLVPVILCYVQKCSVP